MVHQRSTKMLSVLLAAAVITPPAVETVKAYAMDLAGETMTAAQEQQISEVEIKYPKVPSFAELNQFVVDNPYDTSFPDKYDIIPDIANKEINNRIGNDTSTIYGNDA